MSDNEKQAESYKSITKATALFGGTQMISMAANIVKSKLAACIVGAYGLGISAHLYSTAAPIQQLFTCGLNVSAVKEISSATNEAERSDSINRLRRLISLLAITSMLATASSAWWLSQITFGTTEHWPWFVALAIAIFFLILTSGESAILQGCRQLKQLATSNIAAPVAGLTIAIPLYWLWGIEGIAPSIAILGLVSWAVTRYYTRKLNVTPTHQSWKESIIRGKKTIIMGASIMSSNIAGAIATYAINTFISTIGTETELGFYQAAANITLQCTSMIFAAMATDYFPTLSCLVSTKDKTRDLICKEGEMTLLIIVPIVLTLITAAPIIIRVLLTNEFYATTFLLRAMSLSLLSRAFCFPLDYICMAHGDNKLFLIVEGLWSNIKTVALVTTGYYIDGLDGIGVALIIGAIIDIIISMAINKWRYSISYSKSYFKMAAILIFVAILCFYASLWDETLISYTVMATVTVCTYIFVYKQIDRRIDIKQIFNNRIRNIHGRN